MGQPKFLFVTENLSDREFLPPLTFYLSALQTNNQTIYALSLLKSHSHASY